MKNRILAVIVASLAYIATSSMIHGNLLSEIYLNTAHLWRGKDMSPLHANLYCVGYVILFVIFYEAIVKSKSLASGTKFGFFFGLISGFQMAGAWIYMPISLELAGIWFGVGLLQSIIIGAIVGKFLK